MSVVNGDDLTRPICYLNNFFFFLEIDLCFVHILTSAMIMGLSFSSLGHFPVPCIKLNRKTGNGIDSD